MVRSRTKATEFSFSLVYLTRDIWIYRSGDLYDNIILVSKVLFLAKQCISHGTNMASFEYFIHKILPAALWPRGRLSL